MSLISEGLKKAHLEAQRQDREERRRYMSSGVVDAPRRDGVSPALVMLAAALGGALVFGSGAVYLMKPSSATPVKASSVAQSAVASIATPVAPPVAAAPQTTPSPAAAPPVADAAPASKPAAQENPTRPAVAVAERPARREPPSAAKPEDAAPPMDRSAHRATAEPSPARTEERPRRTLGTRNPFVSGETYASPISGPGGIEVTLSGISSVRGNSVAIMNGTIVRAGSMVGPFKVERIDRERVLLRYLDVEFWLVN